jgi:hypothetical protein
LQVEIDPMIAEVTLTNELSYGVQSSDQQEPPLEDKRSFVALLIAIDFNFDCCGAAWLPIFGTMR